MQGDILLFSTGKNDTDALGELSIYIGMPAAFHLCMYNVSIDTDVSGADCIASQTIASYVSHKILALQKSRTFSASLMTYWEKSCFKIKHFFKKIKCLPFPP